MVIELAERFTVESTLASAWQALAQVPDPEIPVLSIVELGIVRGVTLEDEVVVVRVTPTYSGCPATDVIMADIVLALRDGGFAKSRVDIVLAPAWTTDAIAPEGKRKLKEFGIAPPGAAQSRVDVSGISRLRHARIECPRCGSTRTALIAQFGSTSCKALYRCSACSEPFDYFKPH
ncbi:MAG TPA: 1,2-phenylacetyl-CoA epoxidase subunit PaaD [Casimicrobiaceae bacterium]|nr:1,2-phenylacetyl-CoA epoxidase subunit PaaD [Casimicrobiaceae bacterium]